MSLIKQMISKQLTHLRLQILSPLLTFSMHHVNSQVLFISHIRVSSAKPINFLKQRNFQVQRSSHHQIILMQHIRLQHHHNLLHPKSSQSQNSFHVQISFQNPNFSALRIISPVQMCFLNHCIFHYLKTLHNPTQ